MKILKKIRRTTDRIRTHFDPRRKVHFLHIGKTAGTQIGNVAAQINKQSEKIRIIAHHHGTKLRDIPSGEDYFFSIRHPVSRFKSGFYSRKRKGLPRYHSEWSKSETKAFKIFEHANDLAESLFEPDEQGVQAAAAMQSISHVNEMQASWFVRQGFFLELCPPLAIIRQEEFGKDLDTLITKLNPKLEYTLEPDATIAHKNNYNGVPPLSEKAKKNLSRWYASDIAFYEMCEKWINRHQEAE